MKSVAQNQEDLFVLRYFGNYRGNLLSIGENDGQTFSNVKLLVDEGFNGWLVEPASVFRDLQALHADNPKVKCYNYGIGEMEGQFTFYESAEHVPGGVDRALVSSFDQDEIMRWTGVKFEEKVVPVVPFDIFWLEAGLPVFDYISIDAEAMDKIILQQIDLQAVGCRCLIIEWNGDYELYRFFVEYCGKAGLQLRVQNNENLIFVK